MKFSSASYAGGLVSICSAITLSEVGIIAGIVTALLTCCANLVYVRRKDRREQRESDARIACLVQMKVDEVIL
jgi:hypothetical protein